MNKTQGVWPVMLTPFTQKGGVDYDALERLIDWYQKNGAKGLFALCQSSEIFNLSLQERVEVAAFVKKHANVPVIASGHVSDDIDEQKKELKAIADTGVDALVLISNRLQVDKNDYAAFKKNMKMLLDSLPAELHLGCYECPYPYKRILEDDELKFMVESNRFYFLKDTCCDIERIRRRIRLTEGSHLGIYNAHSSTLLESLKAGCAGFSGVMTNFHPELYVWLCENWREYPRKALLVQAVMTMTSLIERQLYPVNAKTYLTELGILNSNYTRVCDHELMTPLFKDEVWQMQLLVVELKKKLKPLSDDSVLENNWHLTYFSQQSPALH